jgi:hypothetical protein
MKTKNKNRKKRKRGGRKQVNETIFSSTLNSTSASGNIIKKSGSSSFLGANSLKKGTSNHNSASSLHNLTTTVSVDLSSAVQR